MKPSFALFAVWLAVLVSMTLCSASVLPQAVAPPVEKKAVAKKAARKTARLHRLQQRYERATAPKVRLRLQDRIDRLQHHQETTTLEILALIFAILFPPVGLILAIIAKSNGGGTIANVAFWISLVQVIISVVILILALFISLVIVGGI